MVDKAASLVLKARKHHLKTTHCHQGRPYIAVTYPRRIAAQRVDRHILNYT